MVSMRSPSQYRGRTLRSILVVAAAVVGAAVLASHAALAHCRRPAAGTRSDSSGSSDAGGAAAARAAQAAAAALQQPATLQPQQSQQEQQPEPQQPAAQQLDPQQEQQQPGRHLRPVGLDAPADSGTLGLAAARAAAAADAPAPVPQPGVIPKILHRIYIADPNDPKRWVPRVWFADAQLACGSWQRAGTAHHLYACALLRCAARMSLPVWCTGMLP